jgi:hypothetical protein
MAAELLHMLAFDEYVETYAEQLDLQARSEHSVANVHALIEILKSLPETRERWYRKVETG